jgi:uncharacterized membrane protein
MGALPLALARVLLSGALVCALLSAIGFAVRRRARPVAAGGDAGRAEREFRRVAALVLLGAEYFVALTFAALVLAPLAGGGGRVLAALSGVQALLALVAVLALARLGQGGTRRAAPAPEDGAPVGDRTRDARWKWGLFYADRADPALFVEKRFGIGWTLNFGNRWSWAILALSAAVPLASILITRCTS